MREHPIPQDVTSYKFHIVGNMTLKQFVEIAFGFVLAVIVYNTNLIAVVKWPLMLLCSGLGIMIAFVPIEERPLDFWITTFFKIMYKPTQFYWRRNPKIPSPFLFQPNSTNLVYEEDVDLSPIRRKRIQDYLTSINPYSSQSEEDALERDRINQILGAFQSVQVNQVSATPLPQKPSLGVRTRALTGIIEQTETSVYERVKTTPADQPAVTQPQVSQLSLKQSALKVDEVAPDIAVPEMEMVRMQHQLGFDENGNQQDIVPTLDEKAFYESSSSTTQITDVPINQVRENIELPFPTKPDVPNKLVGMVLTQQAQLITNAIVEIKNLDGQIVRAVKTNPLGQFFITTPLSNGTYVVTVEKDGYTFMDHQLELTGTIVDPIEVRSQE